MTKDDKEKNSHGDYEVGFGKPPKHGQFQKGKSGNPKGRPKGTNNFSTDVMETLKMLTKISDDGKTRKVSTQKAALLRLRQKALKGDSKALDRLLQLSASHNDDQVLERDLETLSRDDEDIMKNWEKRTLARQEPSEEKQPTERDHERKPDGEAKRDAGLSDCETTSLEEDDDDDDDDDDSWLN